MKRYTEEEMLELYGQWQASGMSRVAFAEEQGIPRHTFYYWTSKFDKANTNQQAVGFQSITVESPQLIRESRATAILHFPSGVVMELQGSLDAQLLQTLTR